MQTDDTPINNTHIQRGDHLQTSFDRISAEFWHETAVSLADARAKHTEQKLPQVVSARAEAWFKLDVALNESRRLFDSLLDSCASVLSVPATPADWEHTIERTIARNLSIRIAQSKILQSALAHRHRPDSQPNSTEAAKSAKSALFILASLGEQSARLPAFRKSVARMEHEPDPVIHGTYGNQLARNAYQVRVESASDGKWCQLSLWVEMEDTPEYTLPSEKTGFINCPQAKSVAAMADEGCSLLAGAFNEDGTLLTDTVYSLVRKLTDEVHQAAEESMAAFDKAVPRWVTSDLSTVQASDDEGDSGTCSDGLDLQKMVDLAGRAATMTCYEAALPQAVSEFWLKELGPLAHKEYTRAKGKFEALSDGYINHPASKLLRARLDMDREALQCARYSNLCSAQAYRRGGLAIIRPSNSSKLKLAAAFGPVAAQIHEELRNAELTYHSSRQLPLHPDAESENVDDTSSDSSALDDFDQDEIGDLDEWLPLGHKQGHDAESVINRLTASLRARSERLSKACLQWNTECGKLSGLPSAFHSRFREHRYLQTIVDRMEALCSSRTRGGSLVEEVCKHPDS